MKRVADILQVKGREVHSAKMSDSVGEAVRQMADRNIGALVIIGQGEDHAIVTERDLLRRVVLEGRDLDGTKLRDLGLMAPSRVNSTETVETCMEIMTERRTRHLLVVDGGEISGLISIGDVVKHLIMEQESQIQDLTNYITGKYPG